MGAMNSVNQTVAFEGMSDLYAPIIGKCNDTLPTTILGGYFDEGCIFSGILDTDKTRQECVIDETLKNQQAIYCDGCTVEGGCNLVHSFETDGGTQVDGVQVIEASKVAKSCAGAMVDSVSVDNPFCFIKGAWLLSPTGFPSGYGTVVGGPWSTLGLPCQYVVGAYLCDGTNASNEASAQHGSVDVDALVEHAQCNDLQDAFTQKMESGECQCE